MAYFARRAGEERNAAQLAVHPVARSSHLKLAVRFEQLASEESRRENHDRPASE